MRTTVVLVACWLLTCLLPVGQADGATDLPEPGPEKQGLRLRLLIRPDSTAGQQGYDVQVDLLNVSAKPIALRTGWEYESSKGDIREYLEAAVSIQTEPPIAPWLGQVMAGDRQSPQTESVLKPGTVLSLKWQTTGRHLKNRETDPLLVNPEFPTDGLYAVTASLAVPAADGLVQLLSNTQQVMVGGSSAPPKNTYGALTVTDPDKKTATLALGSTHKVQVGDEFVIHTGLIGSSWRLSIVEVREKESSGALVFEQVSSVRQTPPFGFPKPGAYATFIAPK